MPKIEHKCLLCSDKWIHIPSFFPLTDSLLDRISAALGMNLRVRRVWYTRYICSICRKQIDKIIEMKETFKSNILRLEQQYLRAPKITGYTDAVKYSNSGNFLSYEEIINDTRSLVRNGDESTVTLPTQPLPAEPVDIKFSPKSVGTQPEILTILSSSHQSTIRQGSVYDEPRQLEIIERIDNFNSTIKGRKRKIGRARSKTRSRIDLESRDSTGNKSNGPAGVVNEIPLRARSEIQSTNIYRCTICLKKFKKIGQLAIHTRWSHRKSGVKAATYECRGCKMSFLLRYEYEWHVASCIKSVNIECDRRSTLRARSLVNFNSTNLTNNVTSDIESFELPSSRNPSIDPVRQEGNQSADSLIAYLRDLRTHSHQYACRGCGKSFKIPNEYEWHVLSCKEIVRNSLTRTWNSKKINRRRTRSQTRSLINLDLSQPRIDSSPNIIEELNEGRTSPTSTNRFDDNFDLNSTSNASNFTSVSKLSHIRSTGRKKWISGRYHDYYPCRKDDCLFDATTLEDIMLHEEKDHQAVRSFACTEHQLTFTAQEYLWQHYRTHVTGRQVCAMCDEVFVTKYDLELHMTYTQHKYPCSRCNKRFIYHIQCKSHEGEIHKK